MKVEKTSISGLLVIEPDTFADERGFFMETYSQDRYREIGIEADFFQDNLSSSRRGVVRGLHYQAPPFAQGKLVSVLRGRVMDGRVGAVTELTTVVNFPSTQKVGNSPPLGSCTGA